MRSNALSDPFAEYGYLGYALRAIAHKRADGSFHSSIEIRDYTSGDGGLLHEQMFGVSFPDADSAIAWAQARGRVLLDLHLEDLLLPEPA